MITTFTLVLTGDILDINFPLKYVSTEKDMWYEPVLRPNKGDYLQYISIEDISTSALRRLHSSMVESIDRMREAEKIVSEGTLCSISAYDNHALHSADDIRRHLNIVENELSERILLEGGNDE